MAADVPEISREEIRRRANDRTLILVDVLAPESFATGHLPGARNLPGADIEARAAAALPDRGADIAVYCGGFT